MISSLIEGEQVSSSDVCVLILDHFQSSFCPLLLSALSTPYAGRLAKNPDMIQASHIFVVTIHVEYLGFVSI